jgi:hypothetical protein
MSERKMFICTCRSVWACLAVCVALIFAIAGCGGGAKKPVQTNLVSTVPAPTIQHGSQDVLGGSFIVEPGKYKVFNLAVTAAMKSATVEGTFTASGGNNDIEVFVLEESQYMNWQNGHKFDATYMSGRVTAGKLNVQLPQEPGNYYVVFSNRFSYITNKAIVADVKLHYVG